jgi:hypothetical protein
MKFFGSFGVGSSSVWKYFMTCESCFQKLSVSYITSELLVTSMRVRCDTGTKMQQGRATYLEFLVAVEKQDINRP